MHQCKTKLYKSKVYVLLYKQTGFRELISNILAYGTFETNYGQPWFISNVPRMQLISFYELCTMEFAFAVRCEHGIYVNITYIKK